MERFAALAASGTAAGPDRRRLGGGADLGQRIEFAREAPDSGGAFRSARRARAALAGRPGDRAARQRQRRGPVALAAPVPYAPDRAAALPAVERFLAARAEGRRSLDRRRARSSAGPRAFSTRLASIARSVEVVTERTGRARAGRRRQRGGRSDCRRSRARTRSAPAKGVVRALDEQGREIGEPTFDFGANDGDARFDLPVELRNDIARLVDRRRALGRRDLAHRRAVAPARSRSSRARAPTSRSRCSRRTTISRALQPFADVSEWHDSASDPIVSLLDEKPSVLVLADMSVAPGPELDAITHFVDDGGVLLAFRGHAPRRRRRHADPDRAAARRAHARRRPVLGDAQAYRAVRGRQPVLRPRRAGRGDGVAPGARRAGDGPGRQDLGAARRRHAACHRRAARQGAHRAVPRHRRHDLVEPAAVGPVRRHAAPNRGRSRRAGSGRRRTRRSARTGRSAPPLAHARRFRRARAAAAAGRADRRRFFRRRRRRASAGLLRRARTPRAPSMRCAHGATLAARRLWPLHRARGRARDHAADRSSPLAAAGGSPRPPDRRAGLDLADGRRACCAGRRALPPSPSRPRSARFPSPTSRGRRSGADLRARHRGGVVGAPRLCRDRRRDGRRNLPARADGADARARPAHLGRARRAGRARSGARRTRLLSADLLADRRRTAAAEAGSAHAHRRLHEERRHGRLRHPRRADLASGRLADARGALAAHAAGRASTCRSWSRCRATTS